MSFRGRRFLKVVILTVVRWYLAYPLSYRQVEEMLNERGVAVGHTTVYRWVRHYAPLLCDQCRRVSAA